LTWTTLHPRLPVFHRAKAIPAADVISDGPPCPVCLSDRFRRFSAVDGAYGRRILGEGGANEGPFWVCRCVSCGHLAIRPVPSAAYLAAFYRQYMSAGRRSYYRAHYEESPAEGSDTRPHVLRARRRAHALWLRTGAGRVLDVGCGPGAFLEAARAEGFDPFGLEVSEEAAASARRRLGSRIAVGPIEQAPWREGAFDAVTLWDVLEHLRDPVAVLARVHRLLRPGGWIALETPDAQSLLHRTARAVHLATGGRVRKPMAIYDVHHLNCFSATGLRRALALCGFRSGGGWKEGTPLDQYGRPPFGSAILLGVQGLFAAAEILGWQNKLIVFARRM